MPREVAKEADAVVFVVGFDHDDEGEFVAVENSENYTGAIGGDRKTLGLHADEVELIKAAGPENKNSAVVMIGGNMIMMTDWVDCVSSVLMAFYPGQEGGSVIARIIIGDVNPSGKLPFCTPYEEKGSAQVTGILRISTMSIIMAMRGLRRREYGPCFPMALA